jgi:membrane protein YqaA with SNARE-associated domain
MNGPQLDLDASPAVAKRSALSLVAGWTRGVYDWVLHWADTPHAVAALVVLSFAEASFFPIPPDVLLIALCVGAPKRGLRFAAACSLASVVGGLAGYGIGALAWAHVGRFFYQYIPGFTPDHFEHVRALYARWGIAIVFTAGFSPIPYKLFTIVSGVMGLPITPFVAASAVSRSARFFLVAGLIYRYGAGVKTFIDRHFNWLALAFSVLLVGGVLALRWLM